MSEYYTPLIFISIGALIVMEFCVIFNDMLMNKTKKLFALLFLEIIIAAFCEWLGMYLNGKDNGLRFVHIIAKTVEFSLVPFISLTLCRVFSKDNILKIANYIGLIHAILIVISAFTGFIFYIDVNNLYQHGVFYFIYVTVYILSAIFSMIYAFAYSLNNQYTGGNFIFAIFAFLVGGLVWSMTSGLHIYYMIMAFSAMMIYIFNSDVVLQVDQLTNLLNRRGYENYINHVSDEAIILYFDLDCFKDVNDNYGHSFGDVCLKLVSKAIFDSYRYYGKCFRIGGDEFCAILHRGFKEIEEINTSFTDTLEKMREEEPLLPYVSYGYVFYNPDNESLQDVVKAVDEDMYRHKKENKAKMGLIAKKG